MSNVHPLCVLKALRVAERLAYYEYNYLHAWDYALPPQKHHLEKLIDDLKYLREACILDKDARYWIDKALEEVQTALLMLERKDYSRAKDRVRDAHAALSWAILFLEENLEKKLEKKEG